MTTLYSALEETFGDRITCHYANGGFFAWLGFPEGVDTEDLLKRANPHGVGFLPGSYFSCQKRMKNYLRLSFAYYKSADLREGVRRLAAAL